MVHFFLPGWSRQKSIVQTVHIALPKRPVNLFKLDQQSGEQSVGAFCPNTCSVTKGVILRSFLQAAIPMGQKLDKKILQWTNRSSVNIECKIVHKMKIYIVLSQYAKAGSE